jgi:hypothetical protein
MKLIGAFKNPKTGEIRVAFKLESGYHAVTKLFRTDDEFLSVKFWLGDFKKTMSFWSTKERISDPAVVEEARKRIITLMKTLH